MATLTTTNPTVTVIEEDNTSYSLQDVTKKFYAIRTDDVDFLVIFNDYGAPNAYSVPIQNQTQGIGTNIFDSTSQFGSNGKLKTVANLGNPNGFLNDNAIKRGLLEEAIAHSWGIDIGQTHDTAGAALPVQNSLAPGHWSPCMSFSGQDPAVEPYWKARLWNDNGDGTWIRKVDDTTKPQKFDTILLYLMGFIAPSQVQPAILLNPSGSNKDQQCIDSFYSGNPLVATPRVISINDVINEHGARIPDYQESQKDFKIGYILVVPTGSSPSVGTVEKINQIAVDFIPYFNNAVTLNVSVSPTPTLTPTSTPLPSSTPTPTRKPSPTPTPSKKPTPTPTPTPIPAPVELLQNKGFENTGTNWLNPWTWTTKAGASGTLSHDSSTKNSGTYSAKASITQASTDWYLQLIQRNIPLVLGKTYTVSFYAKANINRNVRIGIQQTSSPYALYFQKTFAITSSWKKYTTTYVSTINQSNSMLEFNLAQNKGQVWIDDVSLTRQ